MLINDLMASLPSYYSVADRDLVMRAYQAAELAHRGQKRASGDPYVSHCVAVAQILADLRVPPVLVAAALLHDTVEDTGLTLDALRNDFGDDIAKMVDSVTKLKHLPRVSQDDQYWEDEAALADKAETTPRHNSGDEVDASPRIRSRKQDLIQETLRKTFMAMGDDPLVVLIKLADRLHNMRTLAYVPEEKRVRIAQETLDIFAPLANRMGIWQIKWELEDLSFRHVDPEKYSDIARDIAEQDPNRKRELDEIIRNTKELIERFGVHAEIFGRPKHIYSIYRKMQRKGVAFDDVHDVRGVRIIVPDVPACYTTLGIVHTHWHPIPGQFDDYIAAPKENQYQSLHTAVVYDDGKTLEVQIRTPEMDHNAELGFASHWRYKEGATRDEAYEKKISWFRSVMDWRQDVVDAGEFVDSLKTDVFQDRVYVFTPKGDIIDLPAGSTPIDFAYHVHTDIGNRCRGAKVDGKLVPLEYILKTGERVDILTAKRGGPSRDWLNSSLGLVKTQRAKAKIRYWFKRQAREKNINQGREMIDRELRRLGLGDVNLEQLARYFEFRSLDDLLVALGCGEFSFMRIANHLMQNEYDEDGKKFGSLPGEDEKSLESALGASEEESREIRKIQSHDAVTVVGLKGLLTTIARCCNPVPGDAIIGYVTRGRGATIHRQDCPNIYRLHERERLIRVSWGESKRTYPVLVRVRAYDRSGLTHDISSLMADEGISLNQVQGEVNHDKKLSLATMNLILEVKDIEQLTRFLTRVDALPNVFDVHRVRPG